MTQGRIKRHPEDAWNMRLLARHDLGGYGNCGEGVSMQVLPDGRRLIYIAHVQGPKEYSVLDVTEPSEPRLLYQTDLPHSEMRPNCLTVLNNLLLQCYQVSNYGGKPAGLAIIDVEEPENPRQIGFFDASGPGSVGTHSVWFVDGRYAHIASGMPDWMVRDERDRGQFYVIVDLQDPTNPVEAGRWWLPGTREGDTEPPPLRHDNGRDKGYRLHNVHVYPERPDRAYLGYVDGGAIILDISDMARPRLVGRNDYHPPISVWPIAQPGVSLGYTHTVFPLLSRDLLVVSDEAGSPQGGDWPKNVWIMDIRDETNPTIISACPLPPLEEWKDRGGRFGSHNVHENPPVPGAFTSNRFIFATFFNGGLRVFDLEDPFNPKEVAHYVQEDPDPSWSPYVPPAPLGASQMNDVFVDDRGIVYGLDRGNGGVSILEVDLPA